MHTLKIQKNLTPMSWTKKFLINKKLQLKKAKMQIQAPIRSKADQNVRFFLCWQEKKKKGALDPNKR